MDKVQVISISPSRKGSKAGLPNFSTCQLQTKHLHVGVDLYRETAKQKRRRPVINQGALATYKLRKYKSSQNSVEQDENLQKKQTKRRLAGRKETNNRPRGSSYLKLLKYKSCQNSIEQDEKKKIVGFVCRIHSVSNAIKNHNES